ncbi:MAG: ABC transporter ATP-binding protein [Rickettsia sp.]|nr:ABC transporter ATP-binding protein [Rickettsia sp.]
MSKNFAIEVQNLVKIYNKKLDNQFKSLDNLNLSIPKGKIFGLLGSNGAGKSSLINIIAGLVNKTSGNIKVLGYDIDQNPKLIKHLIGVVPQEIVLDSFFSLKQYLEITAGYFSIHHEARKTEELLKILGLWDKKDNYSKDLSGGMKRRFLLAKAMVHNPEILILDEPTAGVDLDLRNKLWEYVLDISKNQGKTVIITTHYLMEAQELCDEIAFINRGKIVKQDLTKNILHDLGSKYLKIEFTKNLDQDLLSNIPNLIKMEDNKLFLNIDISNDLNPILKSVSELNLNIKNIEIVETDLEDVFHQIIKS